VDGRARAQLVERHLDVARRAAAMIHPRVRDHIPFDDLMAFASAGLAEAAARYDPAYGVTFPAYAWYRVNGAIIDGFGALLLGRLGPIVGRCKILNQYLSFGRINGTEDFYESKSC